LGKAGWKNYPMSFFEVKTGVELVFHTTMHVGKPQDHGNVKSRNSHETGSRESKSVILLYGKS